MRGPCAKRQVECTVYTRDTGIEPELRSETGTNDCDNPQQTCPRLPGEGYEKCRTICQQTGHAEIEALRKAKERGLDLSGGSAYIFGHNWICNSCGQALVDAGIKEIHLYPLAPQGRTSS